MIRFFYRTLATVGFIAICILARKSSIYQYRMEASVKEINGTIVTFEDTRGHIWDEKCQEINNGKRKYDIGDSVVLTFDDNDTDIIIDDVVINVEIKSKANGKGKKVLAKGNQGKAKAKEGEGK